MTNRNRGVTGAAMAAALCLLAAVPCRAQSPGAASPTEAADLAKKLSNPISNLVSVPFQLNWEQGVGPNDQTRFVLNVQPVMPFPINKDWNLIARVILPFVSQPPLTAGGTPAFGVSDVLASAFFSPNRGGIIWGVGPVVSLPSTSVPTLGSEKWSAGPTAVVLRQSGPWTYGVLWNQIWSFAGNAARQDVSQMFVQPFLSCTGKNVVTYSLSSESTVNWKAQGRKWTVPIIVSVAKLSSFGTFPASYSVGVGVYAAKPDLGPSWKLRASMTVLMPRKR